MWSEGGKGEEGGGVWTRTWIRDEDGEDGGVVDKDIREGGEDEGGEDGGGVDKDIPK